MIENGRGGGEREVRDKSNKMNGGGEIVEMASEP